MKRNNQPAIQFICVITLCLASSSVSRAQAPSTRISADSAPIQSSQNASAKGLADVARQKRELAYVRLLAGQRLVTRVRTGVVTGTTAGVTLRQAQASLTEAVQLDATLAEANTLLAEIALYFPPPDIDAAIRYANAAIAANRNNFGAHQILARIYSLRSGLSNQQVDKTIAEHAITELREVTRLAPNDAEAWALLGEFYLALGRTNDAIKALTRWNSAPVELDGRYYARITGGRELTTDAAAARLGEALMDAGQPKEAFLAFHRALSLQPDSDRYFALLGMAIESGGATDAKALSQLRMLVAEDPNGTRAVMLLAQALARNGQLDEAVQTLRNSIGKRLESDKDGATELKMALAQIYSNASRFAEAIAAYEDVLKAKGIGGGIPLKNDADKLLATQVLRRILELNKRAGNSTDAIATIDRTRKILGDSDPTVEIQNIELLRDLGMRKEALKAASSARSRFPQHAEFAYFEASSLTELGRVDEGVAILRSLLSQSNKSDQIQVHSLEDIEVYLRISSLYAQAGRGAEAVAAARQALDYAPPDRPDIKSTILITLSSAQERAGDLKGSEASLRLVLESEPNNSTALNNLGYFLVERNERLNEALDLIQRAVKNEPNNGSFLDSLGWAYFKLGKIAEAEQHLIEAARHEAGSATIHEHLGDVYESQGKRQEARKAWEASLKVASDGSQVSRLRTKLANKP